MNTETKPEPLVAEGPVRLALHADGVAHLQLARPESANGLNVELLRALHEAVLRIHGDGNVKIEAYIDTSLYKTETITIS